MNKTAFTYDVLDARDTSITVMLAPTVFENPNSNDTILFFLSSVLYMTQRAVCEK